MTTEEKIVELETNCKAMTAEIEKLKAELAEKNETVWIPKSGDLYMYVASDGIVEKNTIYCDDSVLDSDRTNFNNIYHSDGKTKEHLEWYSNNVLRVHNRLMQLHELLCPDYFPDWENINKYKFYLYYNYDNNTWDYDSWSMYCDYVVYFTKEAAEKACEILNREKFMMEDISENK